MASSPIVARWELSRRLTALRKGQDIDVKAITDHLGFTRNYWSAIENNRALIAEDKLEALLDLLTVNKTERKELMDLREEARQRGWWREHRILTEEAKFLCGLEAGARSIRTYDGQYVSGLLQTESYARSVLASDPSISPADLDQLVEIRLRRQLVLHTDPPVRYLALLSEAALLQQFAGPRAQSQQLTHIADLVDKNENIDVRVIPFTANPGVLSSAATLVFFDFDREPHLPILGWQESLRTLGAVEHDDPDFRRLELAWDAGYRQSLSAEASLARLREEAAKL